MHSRFSFVCGTTTYTAGAAIDDQILLLDSRVVEEGETEDGVTGETNQVEQLGEKQSVKTEGGELYVWICIERYRV
jgi:hypothetical protein